MNASLPFSDAEYYFRLLRHLPAAVRAELISRLATSLVAPPAPAPAVTPEEAGFGSWADTPDDYAEQIRAARTPNTRPIPEW